MKNFRTTIVLFLLSLSTSAQEVWTEGTSWEVEYTTESHLPNTTYTLESSMELDGVPYLPLTKTIGTECDTIAYIRSERGDSLVHVRAIYNESILQETLLYDFTKSFEYGDLIRYGTLYGTQQSFIDQEYGTLDYLYGILEEDDYLPIWNGIIYKLGHVEGPLYLFFNPGDDPEGTTSIPKPTNVSHILFGTKGGVRKNITVCNGTNSLDSARPTHRQNAIYDLQGQKLPDIPQRGLYIIGGEVFSK